MEIEPPRVRSWGRLIVLGGTLLALAIGLTVLVALSLHWAGTAAPATRPRWAQIAWACLAVLLLTVIALLTMIYRFLVAPIQAPGPRSHTEHVDAWRLAGERAKVPDEEGGDDAQELPPADDEPKT